MKAKIVKVGAKMACGFWLDEQKWIKEKRWGGQCKR